MPLIFCATLGSLIRITYPYGHTCATPALIGLKICGYTLHIGMRKYK